MTSSERDPSTGETSMPVAGIVPAKGTSERVPGKNRETILGVPLFLWAASNLARVIPRSCVFVDSECEETLALAERHGFRALRRPLELATNATDGNVLAVRAGMSIGAEILVQHLPPMPFLKPSTLEAAIRAVAAEGFQSAFGVRREKVYEWDERGPRYDLRNLPNSVQLPDSIREGMGLYVMRRDSLLGERVRVKAPYRMIDLDPFEAIDIDHPEDLALARAVAEGLPAESDYVSGITGLLSGGPVELLVLDVDGVLTDGGMYYDADGRQMKKFDSKDGLAIQRLQASGVEVAFLSSGTEPDLVRSRAKTLGVERVHCGREPKIDILESWLTELGIGAERVAYLGDDRNDLDCMQRVGFAACPADADDSVLRVAQVRLTRRGGERCVRELIDRYLLDDGGQPGEPGAAATDADTAAHKGEELR